MWDIDELKLADVSSAIERRCPGLDYIIVDELSKVLEPEEIDNMYKEWYAVIDEEYGDYFIYGADTKQKLINTLMNDIILPECVCGSLIPLILGIYHDGKEVAWSLNFSIGD